jgi:glycosyltransferase involved in cell wall biosynthesis
MPDLSVIVCTHNPRPDFLRRTLDALKAQSLPHHRWELLLIDNASQNVLADQWDLSWHKRARHIREDDLGITPARIRGIRESVGELLVFVDDDNVLARDFLERAAVIARRNPNVAVFGAGFVLPEFEATPPPLFGIILPGFAPRRIATPRCSNNPNDSECTPWGTGLCVTRAIAGEYQRLVDRIGARKLLDRQGQLLFSHGDDLFSWTATLVSKSFGIFPELQVVHLIPKTKLNRKYALRLISCSRFSHCMLHYLVEGEKPNGTDLFRFVRICLHGLRWGLFSMQCHCAAEVGNYKARRLIARNGLHPLNSVHCL